MESLWQADNPLEPSPDAMAPGDHFDTVVAGAGLTGTHLGGVVSWNDAEQSWDCPLHGSRFAPDGSVLEGPATASLPPVGS